jgi:hypothetical protein
VTGHQVEAVHSQCEDTGINKRVIVSSAGFSKTIRTKGERYGIDCLTFAQVESIDSFGQREITFRGSIRNEDGLISVRRTEASEYSKGQKGRGAK